MMTLFKPGPERTTLYFCKQCEREAVSGNYAPSACMHCKHDEFWSEFNDNAPCNRHEEEENLDDDDEYYWDGEETFYLKRIA